MDAPLSQPWSDEPALKPVSEAAPLDAPAAAPMGECWRCGKDVSTDVARCPYCDAPLATEAEVATEPPSQETDARSLVRLLTIFAVMLGISVLAGLIRYVTVAIAPHEPSESGTMLVIVLILEGVDTVLILAAWAWCGIRYREPHRAMSHRVVAWALALPILAGVLAINVLYHHVLQREFGVAHDPVMLLNKSLLAGWVFAICVQPAIMEELFFRYLAFGALRSVMGGNAVVWVTAVMFAAVHVGVPLSLPVLFVLGVFLGYARWASGGIYLPIVLHFIHNAVVMALNAGHF
jgi:membrane protease YdiL (CAAX protease family)